MPRRRSSLKRKRADRKRYLRNLRIKRTIKKKIKQFERLLLEKNIEEAKKMLPLIYSQLDKAAKKKIFHPNKVNRKKSRLALKLKKISLSNQPNK